METKEFDYERELERARRIERSHDRWMENHV